MGAVYRCLDTSTGRLVALKQLICDPGMRARAGALFEREYHTLAGFQHPRIIEVYDYGIDRDAAYYTMELLDGRDLRDLSPLPWRDACQHLRDVATSLALLHARRLLHRDISPRNVRLTGEGRAKLIDFGALTSFGIAAELVGTPPGIAPEALRGAALDQRSDLYALGALSYWALTGRHAYPARAVSDLMEIWRYPPELPSAWSADVPSALDELVMSLLRLDPLARPTSAAEVIDRLNAIAALAPEEGLEAGQAYLLNSVFVGRDEPMQRLRRRLQRMLTGQGGSLLVEAAAGMGRSALLGELLLDAQLQGATALRVEARMEPGAYGVARGLSRALLTALPELALRTLQPHLPILAHVLPELTQHAGPVELAPMPNHAGEHRARARAALEGWLLAVAAEAPLLLLVDDLPAADEDSVAILAALARAGKQRRLLVVATADASEPAAVSGALEVFEKWSGHVVLRALDRTAVDELVKAFFGDVPNAARVAAWLYELGAGVPARCMELLRHLVNQRVVRYTAGSWVLAHELVASELPRAVDEALAARVAAMRPEVRALAEALSIQRGGLPLQHCVALADTRDLAAVYGALDELVASGVLDRAGDHYAFAQEALRKAIASDVDTTRRRRQHVKLAEVLLAAGAKTPEQRLEIGWHMLRGGEAVGAAQLLAKAAVELAHRGEGTELAIPALEAALAVFQKQGRTPKQCSPVLILLTVAGYYADRRLTTRHGEAVFPALLELTGGALALRLPAWLPARLRLYAGLVAALVHHLRMPKRERPGSLREAFLGLFGCAAAMTGVYTSCYDLEKLTRVTKGLEPYAAFGHHHVAAVVYRFGLALSNNIRGAHAAAHSSLLLLADELAVPGRIRALPDEVRLQLYVGTLYMCAVTEMLQETSTAFERAAALENSGMLFYRMHADLLRMFHHAYRGEARLADQYREKVELHALRGGISWYMALFIPMRMLHSYYLTRDIVGLKGLAEQLDRAAQELPTLVRARDLARARIELLRGNARAALAVYERVLAEPASMEFLGWQIECANYAEALNELREHERAKQLCSSALERLSPQDRTFAVVCQALEHELALAQTALGEGHRAAERLDTLLATTGSNPLLRGMLHRDRARIALHGMDGPSFDHHFARMEEWFRPTLNPALIVQCERLADAAHKAGLRAATDAQRSKLIRWFDTAATTMSANAVHSLLIQCVGSDARADRALDLMLQQTGAEHGFIYLNQAERFWQAAPRAEAAPAWVVEQLRDAMAEALERFETEHSEIEDDDSDTAMLDAFATAKTSSRPFRSIVLVSRRERRPAVVGAIALSGANAPPSPPGWEFIDALARALQDAGDCTPVCLPYSESKWSR